MNQDYQMIKVYKKIAGNLVLEFADYQNISRSQVFTIEAGSEFKPVPLGFILSMFYMPVTMNAYKNGLWGLDEKDKEKVVARAKELGLYVEDTYGADELKQPELLYSENQIKSLLQRKRINEIQEIIEKGTREQKQSLAIIAQENYLDLDTKTIQLIEEGLKISIAESDE
jgi:hypothetical protein